MVTPLGCEAGEILARVAAGVSAAAAPSGFDASPFDCPVCTEIRDFDANRYFPENKTLRLMNRDAQLAVVAARLSLQDASLRVGSDYAPQDVALYGATGLAGVPVADITSLVRNSAGDDGRFDLRRFGREALKRVRPVLSFKILANMPICFVSIFEGIRGPNAVYTPWEGQGARAIVAGLQAVRSGRVSCAVVGGCDFKTHALAFISLQQQGVFRSWRERSGGTMPGEGAAFIVLEEMEHARRRGARIYASMAGWQVRTTGGDDRTDAFSDVMRALGPDRPDAVVAAADGDAATDACEQQALDGLEIPADIVTQPKKHLGNLFAAAAAVQVALAAAALGKQGRGRAWANCFGHGSEIASFALEKI
jgi:3-oxoacyl-[acyl-carrier-protein] synthase II